mmetsp:Transcript_38900/g.103349  ORF Transcript_38900/g.103349 Transcript_38900/m.103349 type:complete len:302 (+) Transcript_38900:721-1626(+)
MSARAARLPFGVPCANGRFQEEVPAGWQALCRWRVTEGPCCARAHPSCAGATECVSREPSVQLRPTTGANRAEMLPDVVTERLLLFTDELPLADPRRTRLRDDDWAFRRSGVGAERRGNFHVLWWPFLLVSLSPELCTEELLGVLWANSEECLDRLRQLLLNAVLRQVLLRLTPHLLRLLANHPRGRLPHVHLQTEVFDGCISHCGDLHLLSGLRLGVDADDARSDVAVHVNLGISTPLDGRKVETSSRLVAALLEDVPHAHPDVAALRHAGRLHPQLHQPWRSESKGGSRARAFTRSKMA